MARVVASAAMPIDIRPMLGAGVDFRAPERGSFGRAELLEAADGADALITLLDVAVDAELLSRAPNLRLVANFAVGTDNIDLEEASRRGVVVTNTPDVLTEATADFAFAMLLATARRLRECDSLARSGDWDGWQPGLLLGAPVYGATLGIVGMGRIGRAVAARARGFSMKIVYSGRRSCAAEDSLGAERKSLRALARTSDFVTLHCPRTAETTHLVDGGFLAEMKDTAHLINTARGGCVDTDALIRALADGRIAGAALDVFEDEPAIPRELRESDRVLLAPHAASATTTARTEMATICARAVASALAAEMPPTSLNPEAWAAR